MDTIPRPQTVCHGPTLPAKPTHVLPRLNCRRSKNGALPKIAYSTLHCTMFSLSSKSSKVSSWDPLKKKDRSEKRATIVVNASTETAPLPAQAPNSSYKTFSLRLRKVLDTIAAKTESFSSEWKPFLPMTTLFCLMAFANTIVSNLAMSLVITAPGGGAGVIPFLTAYVAFPMTLMATLLYTYASHFMSRKRLFTITVGLFAVTNLLFALCLYPNHEALHLPGLAETLLKFLPSGFDGAVGMVRNWTFSLFYCLAEMWGDMGITLLFWGFANDITSAKQAPLLYPLMGVGANIAQTLGGVVLKKFSAGDAASFGGRFQGMIFQVVGCMVVVMALHRFIACRKTNEKKEMTTKEKLTKKNLSTKPKVATNEGSSERDLESKRRRWISGRPINTPRHELGRSGQTCLKKINRGPSMTACFTKQRGVNLGSLPLISADDRLLVAPKRLESHRLNDEPKKQKNAKKSKPTFLQSLETLKNSKIITSLGWMAIAQALSTTLMEFVWKSHLKLAYPTPAALSAFMGDIATIVGIGTCGFMLLSPILFKKIGWTGVARITPLLMTLGGCGFFVACSTYHILGHIGMTQLANSLMPLTVIGGAFLFILSRGTKFSMFKPCQEMVYISMEEQERMKGKAAVDVVGANVGKSGGSILQQGLLLASGGNLTFITPVMFAAYLYMMKGWNTAVSTLSSFQDTKKMKESEMQPEEEEEEIKRPSLALSSKNAAYDNKYEDDTASIDSSVVEFPILNKKERVEAQPSRV